MPRPLPKYAAALAGLLALLLACLYGPALWQHYLEALAQRLLHLGLLCEKLVRIEREAFDGIDFSGTFTWHVVLLLRRACSMVCTAFIP